MKATLIIIKLIPIPAARFSPPMISLNKTGIRLKKEVPNADNPISPRDRPKH